MSNVLNLQDYDIWSGFVSYLITFSEEKGFYTRMLFKNQYHVRVIFKAEVMSVACEFDLRHKWVAKRVREMTQQEASCTK